MLLGYNTNGLVHHRLDEAIDLLADSGYGAIAITPDVGHLDPKTSTAKEREHIAWRLHKRRLACVIETGARYILDPERKHRPNLLDEKAADRRERRNFLRGCLELANELEADALSFWAGALPEAVSRETGLKRLADEVQGLLALATKMGVPLALEPEPGMLIETVDEALAFLDSLGNPDDLGLCVDIGHLFVTGEGRPDEILPKAA